MYCCKCGKKKEEGATFCGECGTCSVSQPLSNQNQYNQNFQPQPSNTMAIIGFVLSFFMPIVGLILSIVGLSHSRRPEMRESGRGLAIGGIIVSSIYLALMAVLIVFYVILIMFVISYGYWY